jgi:hypothetical protein
MPGEEYESTITYPATAIVRTDGTLIHEYTTDFLLRVLIAEIHGLRTDLAVERIRATHEKMTAKLAEKAKADVHAPPVEPPEPTAEASVKAPVKAVRHAVPKKVK